MKVLLILAVLVVAAMAVGWLSIQFTDDGANISIDSQKARTDTSQALESVGEAIRNPSDGGDQPRQSPPR